MSNTEQQRRLFNPSRLMLARKRRGFNMTRFAATLGVDLRSVSAWEKVDQFDPDVDRVNQIAEVLNFPPGFFYGEDIEEPLPEAVSFRAMSKMSAAQKAGAISAASIAFLLSDWISARFELPKPNVPDLSQDQDSPSAAADSLRQQWGLGVLPIKNMIHLMELNGVRVFSLAMNVVELDAFSFWRGDVPYIFLNTQKSPEHSRFDAAHELGHLVLHKHGGPSGMPAERQANEFAAAFLMPQADVLARAPRLATVDHLVKLKKVWSVSVAALAYRFHALDIISDWHFRSLFIEIAKRGYRRDEPNPVSRETSQLFQKVFLALRGENISRRDIASELSLYLSDIDELLFGLALTGLDGGGGSTHAKRPELRVVTA